MIQNILKKTYGCAKIKQEVRELDLDILSNLVITGFYSASTMYNSENNFTKRVDRPSWGMLIKYEGETEYYNKGNKYISNSTNGVILPKGSSYEWRCTKAGHYSIIEFDADISHDAIFSFHINDTEKLLRSFKDLEYKQALNHPMKNIECLRDCYSLLINFIRLSEKRYSPSTKQQKIALAGEYIVKNCTRSITNEELAELTGLSSVYFRKLFREIQGVSPIAFAKNVRIDKAKEMLKSDYGSIGEIALSLGYQNIYDFSRDFKKHTGVSPSKFK